MKMKTIVKTATALGLVLMVGQASATVRGYTSNIHAQSFGAAPHWLDLNSANGNQWVKTCYFARGNAALYFAAESRVTGTAGAWYNLDIRVTPPAGGGATFILAPTNNDNAFDSAGKSDDYWESNATHGGFFARKTGWYQVRVRGDVMGNGRVRIDDLSLICMQ